MEYNWNNASCLRLISEYERHPLLWNQDHESYYVKEKRMESWGVMAANLGVEVDEVKYKMNNLLGGFRREKQKKITAYDDWGAKEVYTSRWFAFKPMKFLLKNSDTAEFQHPVFTTTAPDKSPSIPDDSVNHNSDSETSEQNGASSVKVEPVEKRKVRHPIMRERLTRNKQQKRRILIPSTTASRSEDSRIIDALRALHKPEKKRDECDIFGEYIANALRKHDQRTRAMIKHAMNNILFESEMKKYNVSTNYQHVEINLTEETNPLIIPDQSSEPMPMEESIMSEAHEDLSGQKLETIDNSYAN